MTCFSIHKFSLLALCLAAIALPVLPAMAQEEVDPETIERENNARKTKTNAPIVVELFTASDCAACILADRMLYDAMKDKQVIGLSCHIKDSKNLQDTPYTKKQKDVVSGPMDPCVFRHWTYENGRSQSDVSVSIPEFKVNGEMDLGVDSMQAFMNTLTAYHFEARNRSLEVFMQWKDKDTIVVNLPQHPLASKQKISGSVWIIRYKDMEVQKIETGQNAGRVLRFSNIIQDIRHIGKWHGDMRSITTDVEPPKGGKDRGGYVILVQEMMGEPVLAAGKLEDYAMSNDLKKSADPTQAPAPVPKSTGPSPTNR